MKKSNRLNHTEWKNNEIKKALKRKQRRRVANDKRNGASEWQ